MGMGAGNGLVSMKYLAYSPHTEVYACVIGENESTAYYDLTDDVLNCTVVRKLNAASTFTVHLQNSDRKYDSIFTPFDLIKIYAAKDSDRLPLITGYITSANKFQLYGDNLVLSGVDGIGRMQKLYFDPGLTTSQEAMGYEQSGWDFSTLIQNLVCKIGGFPQDEFYTGDMPSEVSTWAKKLYMSQESDYTDAEKIASDFYNVLLTSGPTLSSSDAASADAGLTAGSSVTIPDAYGNGGYTVTLYDEFDGKWANGTNQQKVDEQWEADGSVFTEGIATINSRYLCACTSTFGTVGDLITFYLSDGTAIPCIMADEKSQSDSGCNEWGHDNGQNVLEFEVSSSYYYKYGNPGSGGWFDDWGGKRVASATNYGSIL